MLRNRPEGSAAPEVTNAPLRSEVWVEIPSSIGVALPKTSRVLAERQRPLRVLAGRMVLGDAFPTAVEVFSATFTTGGLRILTAFRAGEGPPLSAGWTPKVTQIFDRRLAENLRQLVEYLGVAQRYSRGLKVVPTYAADFALRKCGVIIKGQEGDDARPVPGGEAVPRSSPS